MFNFKNKKIYKIQATSNWSQMLTYVYKQLYSDGLVEEILENDLTKVFVPYYIGNGVATVFFNEAYSKYVIKNDFNIFHLLLDPKIFSHHKIDALIVFSSHRVTHRRNYERVSQLVFNFGEDTVFDDQRPIDDICSWLRGDSLIKNYIRFVSDEVDEFSDSSVANVQNQLVKKYCEYYKNSEQILSSVQLAKKIYCNVYFNVYSDNTILIPAIYNLTDGSKGVILSVIGSNDMLFASLLDALSVVSSFSHDCIVGVSRETLLANLSDMPLKITGEDKERLVKLRAIDASADKWQEIIIEIKNEHGLHARPAVVMSKIARMFKCPIWIRKAEDTNNSPINARDFMQIVTMGIKCGDRLVISSFGENSSRALKIMQEASENLFSGEYYKKVLSKLNFMLDDD